MCWLINGEDLADSSHKFSSKFLLLNVYNGLAKEWFGLRIRSIPLTNLLNYLYYKRFYTSSQLLSTYLLKTYDMIELSKLVHNFR